MKPKQSSESLFYQSGTRLELNCWFVLWRFAQDFLRSTPRQSCFDFRFQSLKQSNLKVTQ